MYPTPNGPLWAITPGAVIQPVTASSAGTTDTSGHTFAIYVNSFGAANAGGGGNSPATSQQVVVQPPDAPTGLTTTTSAGASGTTVYNLSWNQVTYPSTSVYYIVMYCDFTTMPCTSVTTTWAAEPPQLGTTAQLSFPAADNVGFCVEAENLGGISACS